MASENRFRKIVSVILINALWIIPIGLMIFARTFPEQFDKFWAMLFGDPGP